MNEFQGLFVISFIAVLAPLLNRLPQLAFLPVVALELLLGVVAGPQGLGFVARDQTIGFLAELGLVFLFFGAGYEFKKSGVGIEELRRGAAAWVAAFILAILMVGVLFAFGLVRAPLLVALVLPTTAFGILIPILRESGDLDTRFGRYLLGLAAFGEFAPLALASIVLAQDRRPVHQTLSTSLFVVLALVIVFCLSYARAHKLCDGFVQWIDSHAILPLRVSLLVLLALVVIADKFGLEVVVGAYAAGFAVATLVAGSDAAVLEDRLTAIGPGFLIPIFFVASGVDFNVGALSTSPATIIRFGIFALAFLAIRLAPLAIYRGVLPERERAALAFMSSTTLPIVVAVSYIGTRTGLMPPENAAALVGAAIVTVTAFPTIANALRRETEATSSMAALGSAVGGLTDWVAKQAEDAAARLPLKIRD